MPRNSRAAGFRLPYDARTGVEGFPPLRGMDKESDPGAIADNEFAHVENMRVNIDGILQSRGGQDKVYAVALSGAIEGIFEAGEGVDEPKPVGGASPSPNKPPPVPPGGIVDLILNPRGPGFYASGWEMFTPQPMWQALKDNNHNTYATLTGAALTYVTFLFDQIPGVDGATPITNLVVSVDPLVVGGTDADGFWLTNSKLYIRARMGGVNLDAGPFTPMTDQHIIEHVFPLAPDGAAWTVAKVNATEFGFAIDVPFSGGGNSQPYISKLWAVASYLG